MEIALILLMDSSIIFMTRVKILQPRKDTGKNVILIVINVMELMLIHVQNVSEAKC
jgi:hypothetical protein